MLHGETTVLPVNYTARNLTGSKRKQDGKLGYDIVTMGVGSLRLEARVEALGAVFDPNPRDNARAERIGVIAVHRPRSGPAP